MQKKTLQKTLSGSAKKSRQTTGEEPRRSARQSTQSGGARATYTSLPTKEKAEYVRDLTDRYYRSQRAAETAAKRAESAVRSGGAGSSTHYGSSGRAHGGSSGSFGEPSLYERRQQQKADARREILRRSFDLLGTAAVQSQSAASGYYASPSQQLALARRQADNVQAIKEANARFNEANRVIDWDGRSALASELEDLDRNAGWEISEEQANAAERRRQLLLEKLRAGDLAAGNGIRSGTDADTGRDIVESTAKGIGGASVDLFSNIGKHLERMDTYSWKATDTFSDLWNGQPLGTSRRERIQAYEDPASQEKWKRIDAAADRLSGDSAAVLQRAKEGKSFLGEIGVDAAKSALEMGFDSGVALATGGSALIPMGARVYGQSVGKARRAGANLDQQTAYALTSTAIELASEKLFDGVAGIYGAGAADDITEALVRRLADSDTGRTLLRAVIGSVGEGTEEIVSDLLDPLAEAMVRDESVGELYRQLDPADMLYDYLIGSTIGLFGSGADIATGRNTEANRTLKELDANEAAYLRRMEEIGHLRPEGDKNAALDGTAETTRADSVQKDGSLQTQKTRGIISAKISERGEVINPMPTEEYDYLKGILISQGIEVFAAEDGDDLRYMMALGAEGTYSNGRITHIGKIPSRGTLYEEIIHLAQSRMYGELDGTNFVELYAREIEAQRVLLENKDALNLDKHDIADIVRNLAYWEKQFEQAEGESYDESHYRDNP